MSVKMRLSSAGAGPEPGMLPASRSPAAPRGTLQFVLWSLPVGLALLLPSLWYLFRVFKGGQTTPG